LAYSAKHDLELATFASVEAQVASLADDIAYNNHDMDDGYRAGFFTFAELGEVPVAGRALDEVRAAYPGIDGPRLLYESIRRLITAMVDDAIAETTRRLDALQPQSPDEVRRAPQAVVAFSGAMQSELPALRAFLLARVYRHPGSCTSCAMPRGSWLSSSSDAPKTLPRSRPNGASRRQNQAPAPTPGTSRTSSPA
jgi:dGTPase